MERKFHEQFYRIEPEITIGNLAKVVQEIRESIKKYVARFKTE